MTEIAPAYGTEPFPEPPSELLYGTPQFQPSFPDPNQQQPNSQQPNNPQPPSDTGNNSGDSGNGPGNGNGNGNRGNG
jgi:hypothetical protein